VIGNGADFVGVPKVYTETSSDFPCNISSDWNTTGIAARSKFQSHSYASDVKYPKHLFSAINHSGKASCDSERLRVYE
jgi:hypothetical protein